MIVDKCEGSEWVRLRCKEDVDVWHRWDVDGLDDNVGVCKFDF